MFLELRPLWYSSHGARSFSRRASVIAGTPGRRRTEAGELLALRIATKTAAEPKQSWLYELWSKLLL